MKFRTSEEAVINAVKQYPSISIILPIHTKISMKEEINHQLKFAVDEVTRLLRKNYPEKTYLAVLERLERLLTTLDINRHSRSIAVYASPAVARIFYLDVAVERKIIIDESFETRDLIYAKQVPFRYLVLTLNAGRARLSLGSNSHLVKLKLAIPDNIEAVSRDLPERVFNFSDPGTAKENQTERYLRYADKALTDVLKLCPLPLFVSGPEKLSSMFKRVSTHAITGIVSGNYDDADEHRLVSAIQPHLERLREIRLADIKQRLTEALKENRLSAGVSTTWTAAKQGLGKLLVVEEHFTCPAEHTDDERFIRNHDPASPGFYISDAVDDIIETVVNKGGDVLFVPDGTLTEFLHIALIQYHQ